MIRDKAVIRMLSELDAMAIENECNTPRLLETAVLVAAGATLRSALIARTPFENVGDAGPLNKRAKVGDGKSLMEEVPLTLIVLPWQCP